MLTTPQTYSLIYKQPAWTQNAQRNLHHFKQAELVSEWRQAFAWLAKVEKVPHLDAVHITVIHHRKDKRSLPDCGASMPAAKSSIDGLCDARVLDGDGPLVVRSLKFLAPIVSGFDGLELILAPA